MPRLEQARAARPPGVSRLHPAAHARPGVPVRFRSQARFISINARSPGAKTGALKSRESGGPDQTRWASLDLEVVADPRGFRQVPHQRLRVVGIEVDGHEMPVPGCGMRGHDTANLIDEIVPRPGLTATGATTAPVASSRMTIEAERGMWGRRPRRPGASRGRLAHTPEASRGRPAHTFPLRGHRDLPPCMIHRDRHGPF